MPLSPKFIVPHPLLEVRSKWERIGGCIKTGVGAALNSLLSFSQLSKYFFPTPISKEKQRPLLCFVFEFHVLEALLVKSDKPDGVSSTTGLLEMLFLPTVSHEKL